MVLECRCHHRKGTGLGVLATRSLQTVAVLPEFLLIWRKNGSADTRRKVRQRDSREPTLQSHSAYSVRQMPCTEEPQAPTAGTIMGRIEKLFHCKVLSRILSLRSAEDMNAACLCGVIFPTHGDVKPTQLARYYGHLICFLDFVPHMNPSFSFRPGLSCNE